MSKAVNFEFFFAGGADDGVPEPDAERVLHRGVINKLILTPLCGMSSVEISSLKESGKWFWNSGDDRSRSMRFFESSARLVQFVHHLQQVVHALRRLAVQFVLLLFVVDDETAA